MIERDRKDSELKALVRGILFALAVAVAFVALALLRGPVQDIGTPFLIGLLVGLLLANGIYFLVVVPLQHQIPR